jgi:hypothetical protein
MFIVTGCLNSAMAGWEPCSHTIEGNKRNLLQFVEPLSTPFSVELPLENLRRVFSLPQG